MRSADQDPHEVFAVAALHEGGGQHLEFGGGDVALAVGDLLGAADLQYWRSSMTLMNFDAYLSDV